MKAPRGTPSQDCMCTAELDDRSVSLALSAVPQSTSPSLTQLAAEYVLPTGSVARRVKMTRRVEVASQVSLQQMICL